MAFVFYDTETTGVETAFDQILQFAAVKTDDDLNAVDQFQIRCRLLPYVIPAPGALKTNRITPEMLLDETLPSHYEALCRIRAKLLEWSPAIYVGYNSMEFDERLMRQAFYKTLHPIYLTNTDGNSRADVMRMAQAAAVYAPNTIVIPIDEKGQRTFKLDRLAPANGFTDGNAHEAAADVRATVHMARLIKDRIPQLWGALIRASRKSEVARFLEENAVVSLTDFYFGREYSWLVSSAGVNPTYDAQRAVFDLSYDPTAYLAMSVDELVDVMNSKRKAIRSLRANAQPMLMPADMSPRLPALKGVSDTEIQRRAQLVRANREFQERVGEALGARYGKEEPSLHVEEQMTDSFISDEDGGHLKKFHTITDWSARAKILNGVADERMKLLGARLIYCEHPAALTSDVQGTMKRWVAERLLTDDPSVKWTTIPKALREVDVLMANADPELAIFLGTIRDFLTRYANNLRKPKA